MRAYDLIWEKLTEEYISKTNSESIKLLPK